MPLSRTEYRAQIDELVARLQNRSSLVVIGTCMAELRDPLTVVLGQARFITHLQAARTRCHESAQRIALQAETLRSEYISLRLGHLYQAAQAIESHQPGDTVPDSFAEAHPARETGSLLHEMEVLLHAIESNAHRLGKECFTSQSDEIGELASTIELHAELLVEIFLAFKETLRARIAHLSHAE